MTFDHVPSIVEHVVVEAEVCGPQKPFTHAYVIEYTGLPILYNSVTFSGITTPGLMHAVQLAGVVHPEADKHREEYELLLPTAVVVFLLAQYPFAHA